MNTLSEITVPQRAAARVLIVGAGGNGSAMLLGLPYLHQAMKVWAMPEDPRNVGGWRSGLENELHTPAFASADVGLNKPLS